MSITRTAEMVARSPNTIHGWKKADKEFRERVKELRRNLTAEAVEMIRTHLRSDVETIQAIADGDIEDPKTAGLRFRAATWGADKVLNNALKVKPEEVVDPSTRGREAAAQIAQLQEDDMDDLVTRGTE